jgi:hypothetical protein
MGIGIIGGLLPTEIDVRSMLDALASSVRRLRPKPPRCSLGESSQTNYPLF